MFEVASVLVEAVLGANGNTHSVLILGKKALVNGDSGSIIGVVSRNCRFITNQETVNLTREICEKAFPGLALTEWDVKIR